MEGCSQQNCKVRTGQAKRIRGEAVCDACRDTVAKYLAMQQRDIRAKGTTT